MRSFKVHMRERISPLTSSTSLSRKLNRPSPYISNGSWRPTCRRALWCSITHCTSYPCFMCSCRQFNQVGAQACVRKFASPGALTLRASMWSDEASKFLMTCALAGNKEAMFFLGMVSPVFYHPALPSPASQIHFRLACNQTIYIDPSLSDPAPQILFYCIRSFRLGAGLLSRAAALGHANSLHALAVILFNGSGGTKEDRLPTVAASLCLKASKFGHIQALRELLHCHQV